MATNNQVNVGLSGSTGSGNFVGSTAPTISNPRIDSIYDTNGVPSIQISPTASAVNYLVVSNNPTGIPVVLSSTGADTNIPLQFVTKGTGDLRFLVGANDALVVSGSTSSVNYLQIDNAITGTSPNIHTVGGDNDIGIQLISKGSANIDFILGTDHVLELVPTPAAVNYLRIQNDVTGNPVMLVSVGTDTDIGLSFMSKGTGTFVFNTTSSVNAIIFNTGTSNQHVTNFTFANTAANQGIVFPDASGTLQLQSQPLITAPGNSASSALTVGSNFQNTTGSDIVLTVYLAVTAATAANILLGVGSATNPTQQTIVSGLTLAALSIIAVPIYIPNNYFALLSTSGTITQTISGQLAMPV